MKALRVLFFPVVAVLAGSIILSEPISAQLVAGASACGL